MTAGPLPVRIWERSSAKVTSGDPVQLVFDRPVLADDLGPLVGADVAETEVSDRVDGLVVPGIRRGAGVGASAAHDLSGELGVREDDPGADGGEFEGS